jgi:hypothetical protein
VKVFVLILSTVSILAIAQGLTKERQNYCDARAEAAVATAEARDQGTRKFSILSKADSFNKMHNLSAMVEFVYGEGKNLSIEALRAKVQRECQAEMSKP